jgi:hypothetical protein
MRSVSIAAILAAALALALGGCGGGSEAETQTAGSAPPARFFSPKSFWNQRVDRPLPLDPASPALVGSLEREVAAEQAAAVGPWISTSEYSVPIYTVGARRPTVRVRIASSFREPSLRAALRAVPLPPQARPAAGSDGQLVVWQPATGRLWEFWRLRRSGSAWTASWAGAIADARHNSGVYGPGAWPGADSRWGASGSGLSIAGGLIGLDELATGEVEHALAISLPEVRAGTYASPARRTDGTSGDPLSLPEGARLRLDPELDLTQLSLPPLTRILAEAAQRYGIVVRDRAGEVTFYGEDPRGAEPDPYKGPHGYFEGSYPSELLASFPWQHLQVLELKLHRDP